MTHKMILPVLAVFAVLTGYPAGAQENVSGQNFNQQSEGERLNELQQLYSKLYGKPAPSVPEKLPVKPIAPVPPKVAMPERVEKPSEKRVEIKKDKKSGREFLTIKPMTVKPPEKVTIEGKTPKKPTAPAQPVAPAVSAPAAAKEQSVKIQQTVSSILAPGDKVTVTVEREPDLSGTFALDQEGMADLPLIGKTRLSNATTGGAALLIRNAYLDGYLVNPVVSVTKIEGK